MESININNMVMGDEPTYDEKSGQVTLPQCHLYHDQRHYPILSKTFEGIDPQGTHSFAVFIDQDKHSNLYYWDQITHIERHPNQARLEVFRLVKGHWQHQQYPCLLSEPDYHVRSHATDRYQQVLFQAGQPLQSAELNDMQQQAIVQTRTLANTLYQNGFVPQGRERVISIQPYQADAAETEVQLAACSVYVDGYFYHMRAQTLPLAVNKDTTLGVYLSFAVVDSQADATLTDPAQGRANAGQVGAKRLAATCQWGFDDALSSDGNPDESEPVSGKFYAVQRIVNAQIVNSDVDAVEQWVQSQMIDHRRDLWGGHYILAGFEVSSVLQAPPAESKADAPFPMGFHIGKGKAHVQGFEVVVPEGKELTHGRYTLPVDHQHEACSLKEETKLQLLHQPVYEVKKVQVKQTKVHLSAQFINVDTQVNISNASEEVAEVLRVFVGDTTFKRNLDYKVLNQKLEWLPTFNQLSNNTTFAIEYSHWVTVEDSCYELQKSATAPNVQYINITDSTLLKQSNATYRVDYQSYSLRYHQLALSPAGDFRFFDSQTDSLASLPEVPADHLVLAQFESTNQVQNLRKLALHSLSMHTMHTMLQRIEHLYQLVAEERLARQAETSDGSEYGIFTDSFYHDQQRDGHAETQFIQQLQTDPEGAAIGMASVHDGVLSLPETFQPKQFIDIDLQPNAHGAYMLPLVHDHDGYEVVCEQTQATSSMKINPYRAFQPMPAEVKLKPVVDHWREVRTQHLATREVVNDTRRSWQRRSTTTVSTHTERNKTTQKMHYMRPRTVAFTLKGFAPGEDIKVTMDGRYLTTIKGGQHE
jgi:hypothetical protein